MCGISGIISRRRLPQSVVLLLNRGQGHRGPDGRGDYADGVLGLGHVRLSILDLTEAGAQPMQFRQWVLVFNGEIYNFWDLRRQLEGHGYEFASRSDTEVLLKAWDFWGSACLEKLEGMFAFSIYDKEKGEIHLCRDTYGVKPLFYSVCHDEVLFASELNALVQAQRAPCVMDRDAVSTFLALHYVPAPATGWQDVFKLPPGHYLCISNIKDQPLVNEPVGWSKPYLPQSNGPGATLDDLDAALAYSVRKQMISDVPVGAFLSGGVDSSLICHYATKVHPEPLHTFSIGFSDAGKEYDESAYAVQAAQILGSQHHPVMVELGSLTGRIDEILLNLGELNADTSVFLNHIVSAEARKHVTVCLSGAGGDELFGGYFRHQAFLARKYLHYLPRWLVATLQTTLNGLPQNRDSRTGNLVRRMVRFLNLHGSAGGFIELLRQDGQFPQCSQFLSLEPVGTLESALAFDFRHFLGDNILAFSDKMSMQHGLEVRVPFLDPRVVAVAESLRNGQRVTLCEKKIALKKVAVRYFPRALIYRKKQGFAAPIEVWLRSMTQQELERRCLEGIAEKFVAPDLVRKLIQVFFDEKKDFSLQLYSVIVLNSWNRLSVLGG
jgi:asparagine synthase (glutamine-hydrolysing)